MNIHLLTLDNRLQWSELLEQIPALLKHPGLTPAWYHLFEARGNGQACCIWAEDERGMVLYPFLKNRIPGWPSATNEPYYDIQGAPGYNGLVTTVKTPDFMQEFHLILSQWCVDQHVVAEFSRCDPATGNHRLFPETCLAEVNRNIIADLRKPNDIAAGYDRSAIKNIRKAEREGLTVKIFRGQEVADDLLATFAAIYHETMTRNNAMPEYLFTADFFADVKRLAGDLVLFCFTYIDDRPIACEVVVYNMTYAWSWLGGTLSSHYPLRPNDLLKHRIICFLKDAGVSFFCLGGGMTPDDGIFRYKRSFAAGGETPFYIAKRVHLPEVYGQLMNDWKSKHPHLIPQVGHRLLAYRER
jgi:hypothetical protein